MSCYFIVEPLGLGHCKKQYGTSKFVSKLEATPEAYSQLPSEFLERSKVRVIKVILLNKSVHRWIAINCHVCFARRKLDCAIKNGVAHRASLCWLYIIVLSTSGFSGRNHYIPGDLWQMAVITGYYANLTRSVKLVLFVATSDHLPNHPTKDEPQSGQNSCLWLFHPLLEDWGGDHWLPQIGPHVPLAMVSVLLTWWGWHNIQWLLPCVTNPPHWVMCTKPYLPTGQVTL